jgi:23S rRNA (guanosine2251-2'-O)-methyltransferase
MKKTARIIGRNPVLDAFEEVAYFDKIFLQKGTHGPFEKEIRGLAKARNIPISFIPKEKMNKMAPGNHQGVIALISPIPYYELADLIPKVFEEGKNPLFVLLDSVTDVRNFGAIARSAEVLGANGIVVPIKGAASFSEEAVKSSAGALLRIPICRISSISVAIELLKTSGIRIFASDLNAKKELAVMDFSMPSAFIMGAEGEGIRPSVIREVDETFIIPQAGKTDSLNVSVANGIILYEILKQRKGLGQ